MTDRDLDAVIAYLRTLKPVKNKVADPVYKMPQVEHAIPPGGEKPFTEAMMSDKVKKGFYLVTIAHCMECHTPMGQARPRVRDASLAPAALNFPGPWGVSVSRNITSSKTKGIGAWTDDEIKRAITAGVSKDGSKLKPPMGYHYYATADAGRSRCHRRLSAHGAGGRIEAFTLAGGKGGPGLHLGPREAYISPIRT